MILFFAFLVSGFAQCPASYVPWRRRMEFAIDRASYNKTHLTLSEINALENSDALRFRVFKDTTINVECPFDKSWTLDSAFVVGCEKCHVKPQQDSSRRSHANVVFRFGYGRCAENLWPPKIDESQIYASASGEARSGSGYRYYNSEARLQEDVFVGFDERDDVAYSFSEFSSLKSLTHRTRVSHVAEQWLWPVNLHWKSQQALVVISNCNSITNRNHIISTLRLHGVSINGAGLCESTNYVITPDPSDVSVYQSEILAASAHRFLFALENTIESSYITEKLHHAYLSGAIPIVWNRGVVEKYVPENSFLSVDDYDDVPRLAQHINYLTRNDTAYMEYFRWKDRGLPSETVKMLFRSIDLVGCQLCEMQNHNYSSKLCGMKRVTSP